MLKIESISLKFLEKVVLDDISLLLEEYSLLGIIGPNGAGKSSLLKLLSQNIYPNSGVIYLNKKELNSFNKKELAKIRAFVSAQENLHEMFLDVYQYISYGRAPYQNAFGSFSKKDFEIIEKVIDETQIRTLLTKDLNKLSSGEKQRVQIARALVQEPTLLLLDEPTAHLDINFQIGIMKLLKNISKNKVQIIVILHDLNLSSHFCEQLLLLNDSKIVKLGTPEEVLTKENLELVFKNKWDIEKKANFIRVYPILD